MIRYICLGIHYTPEGTPDWRLVSVDAEDVIDAIGVCEGTGNVKGTTTAWTDEAWFDLATDLSGDRADYVVPTANESTGVK